MAECSSLTEECGRESEDAFIAMWQGKPELYDVTSASKAPPFWVRTNSGATRHSKYSRLANHMPPTNDLYLLYYVYADNVIQSGSTTAQQVSN